MKRMTRVLAVVVMALGMSLGAHALTGSGDSASGPLETVRPTLDSVMVTTGSSLDLFFSEPMLAPGPWRQATTRSGARARARLACIPQR